jgi:hypothetical protein
MVFITSGWKHLKDPEARSKDIGMSKGFTHFPGRSRSRRKSRSNFWRSHASRCGGFDIDNARRDSEEEFRLAHRFLG